MAFRAEVIDPVLSVATRSGRVESWHRGALAICHGGGERVEVAFALGDVERPVYARSATKPLQALPFFELGLHERLGLDAAEIALMVASHDGTPLHVEVAGRLLARGGLGESALRCGPHAPFDPATRRALLATNSSPTRLHNNCSGKHAGFLLLAQALGDDLARYLEPDSRCQRAVHDAVAAMTAPAGAGAGATAPELPTGLDGCGAPTVWLPLLALARGFCRLANPTGLADVRSRACRTILDAVREQPVCLAGERRFCTALVRAFGGGTRIFAKNGAEGVYVVGLGPDPARPRFPEGLGIAVKIADGSERGYWPVIVETLRRLGAFGGDTVPEALLPWWRVPITNTQKIAVGEVHSVFEWPAAMA
ncbi:MAG: asparaginase [Planctomycetes bacterium]|nr:asparaginase [Planctomycetota bacterium]